MKIENKLFHWHQNENMVTFVIRSKGKILNQTAPLINSEPQ